MNQSRAEFFSRLGSKFFLWSCSSFFEAKPLSWTPMCVRDLSPSPIGSDRARAARLICEKAINVFLLLNFFFCFTRDSSLHPDQPGPAQPAPALPQWIEPKLRKCNNPALFVCKVLRWNLGPLSSPDNNTLGLKHGFLSTNMLVCPYCAY